MIIIMYVRINAQPDLTILVLQVYYVSAMHDIIMYRVVYFNSYSNTR